MPHKCVECGNILEDGTDAMLDGCPDCGGNKFLYTKGEVSESKTPETQSSETNDGEIIEAESDETDPLSSTGKAGGKFKVGGETGTESESSASADEVTDTDEVREELMDQFETIKILEPGSYELNLMNLYSKEERIIALEEDGRYQVMLPTEWKEDN